MDRAHKKTEGKRDRSNRRRVGGSWAGEYPDLVVPELEEALADLDYRFWSDEENQILRKYYKPGMVKAIADYLAQHFPPGRTLPAIYRQARNLGLTRKRERVIP